MNPVEGEMAASHMPGAYATTRGDLELGDILLRTTRLSAEQLELARNRQQESHQRLGDVLVEDGLISPDDLLRAIAEQLRLDVLQNLSPDEVDEALIQRVPIAFAKQHRILPLSLDEDLQILRIVAADPLETAPIDDLRILFGGADVALSLAPERLIVSAINQAYDRGGASTDLLAEAAEDDLDALADEALHEPQDLLEATDDAPIIRLVNSVLQHAVKERASDIHIEPFEKEIRVRFRIDDVLYEPMRPLPRRLQASIASRIKIMGLSLIHI